MKFGRQEPVASTSEVQLISRKKLRLNNLYANLI